jgi:DNA repair photolyase
MYGFINKTRNFLGGLCEHKCAYCLVKGTKILMSDFSVKNIEDIKENDFILGLKKQNSNFNKFTTSQVTGLSKRMANTLIIKTEHNSLQVTPEHPLMGSTKVRQCTDWREAKIYSPYQNLMYIGMPREMNKQKKLGWITGFCEGDGCFFRHTNNYNANYLGFEAVCTDERLLDYFIKICKEFDITLRKGCKTSSKKSFNGGNKNPMITTRIIEQAKKLRKLAEFPSKPTKDFMKGYLAGMLDTDGSVSGDSVRIYQSRLVNKEKYNHILFCCNDLGLEFREEEKGIRILASLKKRLDFVFDFGSQHSKKRDYLILGYSYKGAYHSEISSIEKGGDKEVYNLETSCGNYIANGFIVHNCYVNSVKNKFPNINERYSGEIRLLEKELAKDEGEGNTIFVQDMGDLFAENVPSEFILTILNHLKKYQKNTYLFQTKNPKRFLEFESDFPDNIILGTTIETNKQEILNKISKAPSIEERKYWMKMVGFCKIFLTLEPLIDFDLKELVEIIRDINPDFVNIGADSKNHNLPEPSKNKVKELIEELKAFTEIRKKENLGRLLK